MSGLHGKVAVVTGAARGTGRAHCERLADAGADVLAVDTGDLEDLAATAEAVTGRGRRCFTGAADVRDLCALDAVVATGVAELGGLDIVVANAGIHPAGAPTWQLSPQVWRDTLDVNLTGVWHTVKATVRHIRATGGSIVIISSTNGIRGTANTAHYTASKHAVVGLARTLANELGGERSASTPSIRVLSPPRRSSTRRPTAGCAPTSSTRPKRTPPEFLPLATCFPCRGWNRSTSPTRSASWCQTRGATSPARRSWSTPG